MDRLLRRVGSLVTGEPSSPARKFVPYKGILYEDISEAHLQRAGLEQEGLDVTSSPGVAYFVKQESCIAGVDPETEDNIYQSRKARHVLKPGVSFSMGPWHDVIATQSTFAGYENGVMFQCFKPGCSMVLVAGPGFAFEYDPGSGRKLDLRGRAENGVISMHSFAHAKCFYGSGTVKKKETVAPELLPTQTGPGPSSLKPKGLSFRERMLQQQQQLGGKDSLSH